MNQFVVFNGKVVKKSEVNEPEIVLDNFTRIFKTIWFGFGGIPLLKENIESLKSELLFLKIPIPDFLKNYSEMFRVTKRMLNKNKFYRSGIITVSIFSHAKNTHSLMTCKSFESFDFPISAKGVLLNFSDFKKPIKNEFTDYQFLNRPIWQMLKSRISPSTYQNSIILNEEDKICECINSNIFLIQNKKLATPSLSAGCYNQSIRRLILENAKKAGLEILELEKVSASDIFNADEIFIASEETGIHWILGVEEKRFIKNKVSIMGEKINADLKEKVN